jgi:hypothetical protein
MKQFPIITEITPEVLHGAMDQHARNISKAFVEWKEEKLMTGVRNGKIIYWYSTDECSDIKGALTTDELYELFYKEIINKSCK